jgi:hypothetical protein
MCVLCEQRLIVFCVFLSLHFLLIIQPFTQKAAFRIQFSVSVIRTQDDIWPDGSFNDMEIVQYLQCTHSYRNKSIVVLGNDSCLARATETTINVTLRLARQCFVSPHGTILKNGRTYNSPYVINHFLSSKGSYPSVLSIGHFLADQFYHSMHDMIFLIALIPEEIVKVSYLVVHVIIPAVAEALTLFNLTDRVLIMNVNESVFAEKAYFFTFEPNTAYLAWIVKQRFRELVVRKWELDENPPNYVGILNRPEGRVRFVNDLENLTKLWKEKWPDYRWEYKVSFQSLRDAAIWFNSRKVVIATTGAGCLNGIFMQKGSCLVELQDKECWSFFIELAASIGLDYITMNVPKMTHWHPRNSSLGTERGIELAKFITRKYKP